MGLYLFNKNNGIKLFNPEKTDLVANDLKLEQAVARKLEEKISDLRLQVEGLKIFIDEDAVTVSGFASDKATKNKVILIIGGSFGIATVNDQMIVEQKEAAV